MNTGIQGMQTSYSAIEKAADKISKAGLHNEDLSLNNAGLDNTARNAPVSVNQNETVNPYAANTDQQTIAVTDTQKNIIDPLIDMKIQQHVFDASAKVVKSADEMLGTIMDIKA